MTPGELYGAAAAFDLAFVAGEAEVVARITAAYEVARERLEASIRDLSRQIEAAERNGQDTSARSWRLGRLEAIRRQVDEALVEAEARAAGASNAFLAAQVVAGAENTRDLILRQARGISALVESTVSVSFVSDLEPVRRAVGFLADGSPLPAALRRHGEEIAESFERRIVEQLVEGWNPRKAARIAAEETEVGRHAAETIFRTESIRALRAANHATMTAFAEVLDGWIWNAHLGDLRTCAACIALHGKWFPLSEVMASHPNCRCTQVPAVKGSASARTVDGSEWFAEQTEAFQRETLGDARFEAYAAGEFDLDALVGYSVSPVWGPTRVERSLRSLRADPTPVPGAFPNQSGRPFEPLAPTTGRPPRLSPRVASLTAS